MGKMEEGAEGRESSHCGVCFSMKQKGEVMGGTLRGRVVSHPQDPVCAHFQATQGKYGFHPRQSFSQPMFVSLRVVSESLCHVAGDCGGRTQEQRCLPVPVTSQDSTRCCGPNGR